MSLINVCHGTADRKTDSHLRVICSRLPSSLKPGSHLCHKHNTSEIIKHKHKKQGICSFFLVFMLMITVNTGI